MANHRITVYGQDCDVQVYKDKATVWRAIGQFNGKTYDAKGRSESLAVKHWQVVVETLNN